MRVLHEFSVEMTQKYMNRLNTDPRYSKAKKRIEMKPIFQHLIRKAQKWQLFYGVDLSESIKIIEQAEKDYKIYIRIKL